ncbi:HIPL1 protein-like [Nicotiana tabacum]|uniref:HIPL1 protein-like n=1 Tax=Nicotiana tabacum TaxID=4097 RepID=A0A1S3YGG2_TOBAC|nr:PREDICTED: HIPL1 protein-like [Nicotiana tabacum]
MGRSPFIIFIIFFNLLCPFSLPLCTDSRAPLQQKSPLTFCPYNGTSSCCNSTDDKQLQTQFNAMNITDPGCASLVKSVLCAKCDKFSAELFRTNSVPQQLPILCNSTTSANSTQNSQAKNDFCSKVWTTCRNVSIISSPFAASVKSNFTKLTDHWQSQTDFCNAFGVTSGDGSVCFAGEPVVLNTTTSPNPPGGLCLEKIGNGSYLNMVAHPDGSSRAFFSNQQGKIWLATIPEVDSGKLLELDEANPFLDLTDEVHFDTELGMMGIAFHPKFSQNGRFFASFNCDKQAWPGCGGRCSCNSNVDCDPSKLPSDSGSEPCQYQAVIAEFTVSGTASQPSQAKTANPKEVRRIFTMGLPFTAHHGGQILFGPTDGYLYFMMGDGGGIGDPYNFSQNKKSLLGKIIRLDVDSSPSEAEMTKLGLWGNYSIPKDNPYIEDKELQPEIWALGMRNPWRCSFDSSRPSYFMCADVGQDKFEEVNIISKGGNYGWRVYEGPYLYTPQKLPGGKNTSISSINPIFPVMGYNHSDVNKNGGSASITGGYFYRSFTDPCMHGRYIFADLYAGSMWAGTENPEDSGIFNNTQISFNCAQKSPIDCTFVPGSSVPSLGYIFSYGEDNNKDMYVLASSGVYRVVRPSRCKYTCAKEDSSAVVDIPDGPAAASPPSAAIMLTGSYNNNLVLIFLSLMLMLSSWF